MKTLTVTLTDGREIEVRSTPGDLVRFERHFGIAASGIGEKFEHIMFLAYTALKRTGEVDGDFDSFLDQIEKFGEHETAPLD